LDRIEGKGVSVIEDKGGGVDAISVESSEDKGTGEGIDGRGEAGRLNDVDAGSGVRSGSRSPGTSN
jgi:hypothetical protein